MTEQQGDQIISLLQTIAERSTPVGPQNAVKAFTVRDCLFAIDASGTLWQWLGSFWHTVGKLTIPPL